MPEWHSIQFVWPRLLWLLATLPVWLGLYIAWQARGVQRAWPAAAQARSGPGVPSGRITRHAPVLLIWLGLAGLLLAMARPQAILLLPSRIDTVMLAIDSSGSMRASDVQPSRIEAAQAAAKSFVLGQPAQVKLGVVSVAGAAALVQAPTDQRDLIIQAIDQLSLQPGSALGSGIVIALHAMLPGSGLDVRGLIDGEASPQTPAGKPLDGSTTAPPGSPSNALPSKSVNLPKVPPGSNSAAAIVLLSDGQSNVGPDALKMAQVAADLGVRVYTVGVGTAQGTVLKAQGMQMRVKLDEASLKKIAEITRAEYFSADNRQDLLQIYQSLSSKIVLKKHRRTEVSAVCALLGMLLVCWGCAWAWWRHGRII
ncbi:VWA domain-containing protein [Limnohabitans sp. 2KL-27]|uniref:VWA domain-containing protein n=1 Tax=Limnohabitans sp. 2KL-27 TaxID=1100705 RepID=UPI000A65B107|nr:VWA domain-containing protein [Limnohabitans sp. 2KL-27]